MAQKLSFILYADDYEDFRDLSPAQKGGLLDALFCHALGEAAPELDSMTEMVFRFLRRKLDRDHDKWEATCAARAEAGRKSAQARAAKKAAQQIAEEDVLEQTGTNLTIVPFAEQSLTKSTDSVSEHECESERESESESERDCVRECDSDGEVVVVTTNAARRANNDSELAPTNDNDIYKTTESALKKAPAERGQVHCTQKHPARENTGAFCPPAVEQVQEYCQQRQNGIDAGKFVDYYAARGWRLGSSPMTDWRAALRGWERRGQPTPAMPTAPLPAPPPLADWEREWLAEVTARQKAVDN